MYYICFVYINSIFIYPIQLNGSNRSDDSVQSKVSIQFDDSNQYDDDRAERRRRNTRVANLIDSDCRVELNRRIELNPRSEE